MTHSLPDHELVVLTGELDLIFPHTTLQCSPKTLKFYIFLGITYSTGILVQSKQLHTGTLCEICSKLLKTPEPCQ